MANAALEDRGAELGATSTVAERSQKRTQAALYGMIHQAAREMAIDRLGRAEWERLAATRGLTDKHFIGFDYYDDAATNALLALIAERLTLTLPEALTAFGRYWIRFVAASSYGRALTLAGNDLESFLGNLDRMHTSIKSNMPLAEMPSFELLSCGPHEIRLLYCSSRRGLADFVTGILDAVAERCGERVVISHSEHGGGVEFVLVRIPANAAF